MNLMSWILQPQILIRMLCSRLSVHIVNGKIAASIHKPGLAGHLLAVLKHQFQPVRIATCPKYLKVLPIIQINDILKCII